MSPRSEGRSRRSCLAPSSSWGPRGRSWRGGGGDEILPPPSPFIATAEMIALVGAPPVFVNIDPVSYNINAARIEEAVTKNTRGIIAVSLYGQCPEMEAFLSVAGEYGLFVIQDGAPSFGAGG